MILGYGRAHKVTWQMCYRVPCNKAFMVLVEAFSLNYILKLDMEKHPSVIPEICQSHISKPLF